MKIAKKRLDIGIEKYVALFMLIIGFVMIFSGCMGLGVWYSMQFQQQLHNVREMCRILELFQGQIRFGRCTLPECCLQLTERVAEPFKSCFTKIYNTTCLNGGESFGQICREQMEETLQKLVADKKDKELFLSCFTACGFEEDRMQLRTIEQVKEELEDRLQRLSKENASKCRLAISLGAMSGLLMVILFI